MECYNIDRYESSPDLACDCMNNSFVVVGMGQRLVPTGLGKEGDLLLTAESMVASAHVSCALLVLCLH
jgi:hypothetical protein